VFAVLNHGQALFARFCMVPLVGLVLNYTPFGIRLLPVALSLSGLTLLFLVLALRRKHAYYKVAKDLA